jgi:hypothetical protein
MVTFAFFKGKGAIANALIRWWTHGPYSHTEVIVRSDPILGHLCYSSHLPDGGVRGKWRGLDPIEWDFVQVDADPMEVEQWYINRAGAKYDILGLLGFVLRRDGYDRNKYFCSEANAASIGIEEAWRLDPNGLKMIVDRLSTYRRKQNGLDEI